MGSSLRALTKKRMSKRIKIIRITPKVMACNIEIKNRGKVRIKNCQSASIPLAKSVSLFASMKVMI